jgi:ATP-binding cassette subfamily F protein 3
MNQTRVNAIRAVLGIIVQPTRGPGRAVLRPRAVARYNAPEDPMSLLAASNLTKSYGAQDVLQGVSLALAHQSRTALVGANGVGKSTLLALLAGEEHPDGGRIQRARGLRIGYLPQDGGARPAGAPAMSVWDSSLQAFGELLRKERELARLEAAMADPRHTEEALASYGPLQEAFEREGGYAYAGRTRQILRGLGLDPSLWNRPVTGLSGGERTRLALARLLLEDPGLLLLDEPTNHLDLDAIEWLEAWLRDWPGAALVVSHDRYFLDRVAGTVWELAPGGLSLFPGNYSAYLRQRAERRLEHTRRYQAQQEHLQREQDFIRRNLAGQNTRQAKGRRKRLERWLEQEALERPVETTRPHIRLEESRRASEKVLETSGLVIGHPAEGSPLFSVPDLSLMRGECVAVLGPNGAGKTSLLRTLLGDAAPFSGQVHLGSAVRPGYLAQTEAELRPTDGVLDCLRQASGDMKEGPARSWLARFGLADDAEKTVEQLSGGERRRLALARLGLGGANLLMLDEPTNNLDLPAQESLQDALAGFAETILLATHDRYLARELATQVWVISPNEAALEVFRGSLDEYLAAKEARRAALTPKVRSAGGKSPARGDGRRVKELTALEGRIEKLEQALKTLAKDMDLARGDAARVTTLGIEYAQRQDELELLLETWAQTAGGEEPA